MVWRGLRIVSKGAFRRDVTVEKTLQRKGEKPVTLVHVEWVHSTSGEAELNMTIPAEQKLTSLAVRITQGTKGPVPILRAEAYVEIPVLCFLALKDGAYTLFGGNPKATASECRLSSIESELLAMTPRDVVLGKHKGNPSRVPQAIFKGWLTSIPLTLYGVFALTIALLVFFIVKTGRRKP